MSKFVKDLVSKDIAGRIGDVNNALLVNVIGMSANDTVSLRRDFRDKGIHLLVIKNSLAQRACEGTALAPAFEGITGTNALVWGAEDFVSLVKEVTKLSNDEAVEGFEARGGVMDGERLTAERVKEISKWPNRAEQLSIISGQLLAPGANLSAALLGPGSALASQVKQKSEESAESTEEGE